MVLFLNARKGLEDPWIFDPLNFMNRPGQYISESKASVIVETLT